MQQIFKCVYLHTRTHISHLSSVILTHINITHSCTLHTSDCLPLQFVVVSEGRQAAHIRKGPATGQIRQDFPRFFSVLQQILSWYPKPTLHCGPSHAVSTLTSHRPPNTHKTQPQCTSQDRNLYTYQRCTSPPLPEGRAGTASEPSEQQTPLTPLCSVFSSLCVSV